ncbi:MAG: hypothetical protein IJA85_11990 [Clostridia bacterium]|nr:hypothetical protein [Clostridia bacterium]
MSLLHKIFAAIKAFFTSSTPLSSGDARRKCPGLSEKSAITLDKDAPGKFGFRM